MEWFEISKKTEKAIEDIVKPIITDSGYEYVGTEITTTGGSKELIIYADKPGGIGLDDCEKISRLIEPAIDERDPIQDAYFLCVSSPGLDRPLKEPSDFERNIGKSIDIKLFVPVGGEKEFSGLLKRFEENVFILEINGSDKEFSYKNTAIAKLHVDI